MMERKHIPESENRLVILYALRRLGPVTATQLLQAMAEGDLMNYITMQLSLSELESQGQISQRAHPLGNLIETTQEGRFVLDSFKNRIPSSRRAVIDENADAWILRFANEQMAPAESFPLPDGRTAVHLRLLDSAATLMDLMLYLSPNEGLNRLSARWRSCVQATYTAALTLFAQDYDPSLPMPEAQEDAVRLCGPDDWLLTLAAPGLDLMMSLPEEHLARCSAAKWPKISGELRAFVLQALQSAPFE